MRALRYGALAAVVAIAGLTQAQSANHVADPGSAKEKLIGAWHLVRIDAPGPDGKSTPIAQPWPHVRAADVPQVSECSIQ
jgi:hypothetical protein